MVSFTPIPVISRHSLGTKTSHSRVSPTDIQWIASTYRKCLSDTAWICSYHVFTLDPNLLLIIYDCHQQKPILSVIITSVPPFNFSHFPFTMLFVYISIGFPKKLSACYRKAVVTFLTKLILCFMSNAIYFSHLYIFCQILRNNAMRS